jgi:hypothetical protein
MGAVGLVVPPVNCLFPILATAKLILSRRRFTRTGEFKLGFYQA